MSVLFFSSLFPVASATSHTKKSKYQREIWPDDFIITQTTPRCPKVIDLLEFSVFVPYFNLDLSQCLSELPLHKAPSPSQKKHSLAVTKSLLCWRPSTPTCWFPRGPGLHPCYWVVLKVLTTPPHCFSVFCSQILGKPTQSCEWEGV